MLNRRSVLASATAAAFAPAFALRTARAADAPLTTIRVGSTADDVATPLMLAVKNGKFRAAGLDVQVTFQNSGSATAAAVAGGSFDIGKSSLTGVLNAHLRDIPFRIVAPGNLSDRNVVNGYMLVANDGGIATPKDLNGKAIGVNALGGLDPVAISAWLDANGGDAKSVKFLELPPADAAAALEAHRIAGANLNHPIVDAALETGKVHAIGQPYTAIAPLYLVSGWFATSDYVKANRDAVQRFVRVLEESAAYCNKHHPETASLLADFSKAPLAVIQKSARAVLGTTLNAGLIQPVIDASVKYGALARTFPASDVLVTS